MVKEFEGDLEIDEAFTTEPMMAMGLGKIDVPTGPKFEWNTKELEGLAKAFVASGNRALALWLLPSELIFWSILHASCTHRVRTELGLQDLDRSKDESPEAQQLYQEMFLDSISPILANGGPLAFRDHVRGVGTRELKFFLQRELNAPPAMRHFIPEKILNDGIRATLATMLTTVYAAVETLATDLWIEAMNRSPRLAMAFMEANDKKSLTFQTLIDFELDLRQAMGTILADDEKVSFKSFKNIRNSYKAVFGDEVDSAFTDFDAMRKVEQIRHLFAHRGGVVDRDFRRNVRDFPELNKYEEGTYLELTGPMVREYLRVCFDTAEKLFRFVDDRLQAEAANEAKR
jgi:hypothetical protein